MSADKIFPPSNELLSHLYNSGLVLSGISVEKYSIFDSSKVKFKSI